MMPLWLRPQRGPKPELSRPDLDRAMEIPTWKQAGFPECSYVRGNLGRRRHGPETAHEEHRKP